ncbi:hypothetical protein DOTSEDRAFT_73495 [Dothistroma septosporum NZE10]|uniref:Pathogenesis associated protein Cap20 n=1 Tax=Dothistroma septosporum (strain NZE10 / CBS 128990) TaxID=675120 RepID=N1PMH3_DOTSN|nr:hypothetical protein DOTSEDRAFT_73495 [Dothistroma septosporum NZE10]
MPHATSEQPLTNGDKPSSQFVHHLTSYPVVNDSIKAVQKNPYGKKSIEIADGAYQRFGKPVEPYLETPYSYAKPYVQKVDEIADSGLSHVEHRFPIVKEDTHTIVDNVKSLIWWPYSYTTNTWQDEYSKTAKSGNRGDGISTLILAYISFNLRVASDVLHTVANNVGPKYEESKKKGADYVREAQNQAEHYKKIGQDKVDEYTKYGQQKADEAKKQGEETLDEAKKQGDETKETAKSKANGAKEEAKKKADK